MLRSLKEKPRTLPRIPGGRSILIVNQPMADGGWVATHEDITERHDLLLAHTETEKLLREQKLQLDTALNNMAHGLCMFDAQGHLVLFNQRYCDMMQLPATSLLGRSLLDLMKYRKSTGEFTRDPDQFFASVLAAVRAGETTTRIMETGGGRSMRAIDHPMANGGWVATFEDITEQRQAERERDRNREFLDQIIENVPLTIVVKDAVTRKFVLANRAAERLWSFDRREAIGKTPHDLFPKEKADIMTEHDNRVVQADGPLFFGEHRNLGGVDNGRILTSKRLSIRGDKQPKYIVTVIEDVTERHELEKERDRNREFLDQIIEHVPAIIFVKNASDRRYVLVNRAAENFWGKSRTDILGKTSYEVFSKEEADRLTARDDELLQRNEPVFDERQIGAASGANAASSRAGSPSRTTRESHAICSASSRTSPSARTRSSASRILPITMPSPICPIASCCANSSSRNFRLSAAAASSRSSTSISIISRASTTRSATRPATSCSRR